MDIGELIRDLREGRGWSQAKLATEINRQYGTTLTREYVSRWERGKVEPRGFYLAALSRVLDVPLAVLEGEVDRRTFLTDVAGASIAPVVASDLLSAGIRRPVVRRPFSGRLGGQASHVRDRVHVDGRGRHSAACIA